MSNILFRATIVWAAILVLAVLNGMLREGVLLPRFGTTIGFVASGVILSLLIVLTAYLTVPWIGARTFRELLLTGFLWLILTLAFEFSFGLVLGKTLNEILVAYSFRDGNLWPIVLLVTFLSPLAAAQLRRPASE
ncbi:MAG: hypothetical protein UZ17_ACD001001646 [Acidobacteria bacterium OLB17]|nr:MAG: hypothetical protein UZ17_ACD001001646 [Acidobacteria bacterium OLB17]MCZ2390759.1 hypothetical protein [Acidobacteriota bacterium]